MRRTRTLGLGAVVLTAALMSAALVSAGPAVGDTDPLVWQNAVQGALAQLDRTGVTDAGYTAVTVDPDTRTVTVHLSNPANRLRYTGIALPAGSTLSFATAPLSRTQVDATMDSVVRNEDSLAARGVHVVSVTTDGTGVVTVGTTGRPSGAQTAAVTALAPLPGAVRVLPDQTAATPTGRYTDTSPWYGGDQINSAGGDQYLNPDNGTGFLPDVASLCSTAFTAVSVTNGRHYAITAAHCVKPSDPRVWTHGEAPNQPGQLLMGAASVVDRGHDLAYVPVAGSGPFVWVGATTEERHNRVTAVRKPAAGELVCTLGATSGSLCRSRIGGWGHYPRCSPWIEASPRCVDTVQWYADRVGGGSAGATGDSGGGIVIPDGDTVAAVGVVSAGSNALSPGQCPSGSQCFSRVFFADIWTDAIFNHDLDLTR